MFNRSYQIQRNRSDLERVGDILQRALLAARRRPPRPVKPVSPQLELPFKVEPAPDAAKPLADLFPMAYE